MMSKADFFKYTTEYISGVMSLRKPQAESLKILDKIMGSVNLAKNADLSSNLSIVNRLYPICTNFEREFMSLTFALATGVGKTRLMGAFIAYLYTQHNVRNFFVVAPGTTVYEKLKQDLGNPANPKYVFKGLGCFTSTPYIIADDDYRDKSLNLSLNDINIFVFNIDKFNKEESKMRDINEYLGQSFYKELAALDDLVLIMDESHHYRAKRGWSALNDLHPLLGLELTATPYVRSSTKQVNFKNVVYEYPLSAAIADGYTRTPMAMTRKDIDFYNFGDNETDILMLNDGLLNHQKVKAELQSYAQNNNLPVVKPFMLVVCKDTEHAKVIEDYIKSDDFANGDYKNKVITVHSKQSGAESDANMQLLLSVERADNPVEIVIHVNMLKEGWDVNNLYTIVPLRTAASKILREQMVGRGLRLPYGKRTGNEIVDCVVLTAHDKFDDIIREAQRGDSIFKAGNVIFAETLEKQHTEAAQITLVEAPDEEAEAVCQKLNLTPNKASYDFVKKTETQITEVMTGFLTYRENAKKSCTHNYESIKEKLKEEIVQKAKENKDLGEIFSKNEFPLAAWIDEKADKTYKQIKEKFIPIPQIKVSDSGVQEYCFIDFDLNLDEFKRFVPIENEILIQNLTDPSEMLHIKGHAIDFGGYNPLKKILAFLREKPEIDYEKCSDLLFKLISQCCAYFEDKHGENGMQNIVMMYKRNIAEIIYKQMMQHFYCDEGLIVEEVLSGRNYNLRSNYTFIKKLNLCDTFTANEVRNILFEGIKKGVFATAKFDSAPEVNFARLLERDQDVKNWLRPAAQEFKLTYNNGNQYHPDFVVETENMIYLTEVKGEDKLNDPDVIAKKKTGIRYCHIVSDWAKASGYKEWRYLFIPSQQIRSNSTFKNLAAQFTES